MTTACWALLPAVALSAALVQQPQTMTPEDAGYVTIDGSKDPGSIPEWVVWEDAFNLVSQWRGRESGITQELREGLSATEMTTLEKEAAAQQQKRGDLERRGDQLKKTLGIAGMPTNEQAEAFNERAFPFKLEYRQGLLDARDRLLASLSVESQAVLTAWVNDLKPGIKAFVPRADLAKWRSPQ
jgi:hypothetical protein